MDEKDYPTVLVEHDFFGGKEVKAGDTEKVEIISVDDKGAQIRCLKARGKEHGMEGKRAAERYHQAMGGSYQQE